MCMYVLGQNSDSQNPSVHRQSDKQSCSGLQPGVTHLNIAAMLYSVVSFGIYSILYDFTLIFLYMYYMDHCINLINSYQFTLTLISELCVPLPCLLYLKFHFKPAESSLLLWNSDFAPLIALSCFREVIHRLIQQSETLKQGYSFSSE